MTASLSAALPAEAFWKADNTPSQREFHLPRRLKKLPARKQSVRPTLAKMLRSTVCRPKIFDPVNLLNDLPLRCFQIIRKLIVAKIKANYFGNDPKIMPEKNKFGAGEKL